ncbi:Outer membrane protein assembly factor BamB, contains PQQ-like beta-propeller repeat [Actinoplanes cyaneus]|nr:Outer membrane protein assembly factor BamB, contains PQQ-like beta-propeller repeat [Actinoplanes cyaneus]
MVVAERHRRLVALRAHDGGQRWDRQVEDCWGTLVLAGDRCLYLSQSGVLHCFALGSGEPLWARPGLPLRRHVSVCGDVIFVGGWRGYHPLVRFSLSDGEPLPFAGVPLGPLAAPMPLLSGAVLLAGADRPALVLLAASGTLLDEWPLPEPIAFADGGPGFSAGDDGSVTFLSGRRIVMALRDGDGPRVLWRHDRDLVPRAPMFDARTLWLVDDAGIAVVDTVRGAVTTIDHRRNGPVCAATRTSGTALFGFADGSVIAVDRAGETRPLIRMRAMIDRLLPGAHGLVHVSAKGRLVTFRP